MKRLLAAACLLASCKDEGVETHRRALEKYAACVERGARPGDPCFTEVRALLDQIPKGSSAAPKAALLRQGLQAVEAPKVQAPLAIEGPCQQLAQELGTTPAEGRPAKLRALAACHQAQEEAEHGHGALDGGGG